MSDQPAIPGMTRPTEPDLRHLPIPTGFIIVSARDHRGLAAHTADDRVNVSVADENGEGTHTALTPAQTTLAATELFRITGTNLSEFMIIGEDYPALHHIPTGSGETSMGHWVTFVSAGDVLGSIVRAAADHVCGVPGE